MSLKEQVTDWIRKSSSVTETTAAEQLKTKTPAAAALGNLRRCMASYRGKMQEFLKEVGLTNPDVEDLRSIVETLTRYETMTEKHQSLNVATTGFFDQRVVRRALMHAESAQQLSADGWGTDKEAVNRALELDRLLGQVQCRDAVKQALSPTVTEAQADALQAFVHNGENKDDIMALGRQIHASAILQSQDVIEALEFVDLGEDGCEQLFIDTLLQNVRIIKDKQG